MADSSVHPDFLLVGAGPVGLTLAFLLRSAGFNVLVAEQIPSPAHRSPFSKALSLNAGTLETFRYLGLDDEVISIGEPAHHVDFGLLPSIIKFSPERLGTKHSHNLVISQKKTEDMLLRMCENSGVSFRWGLRFQSLQQDANRVIATFTQDGVANDINTAATTSAVTIEADWLAGCDGSRSAVRQCVDINFFGNSASCFSWLTDVRFAEPGPRFAFKRGPTGPILIFGLGDDIYRVIGFYQGPERPSGPPPMDQISAWLREYFDTDFGMRDPLWASVFGNATHVAETFQSGRVFLAGDAAHQHYPAGGQGINMGIQDAVNLAWKLVGVQKGMITSDAAVRRVLETYTTERRHVAYSTIRLVNAQSSLIFSTAPEALDLGIVISEFLQYPELNKDLALKLTGFDPTNSSAFQHEMLPGGLGGSTQKGYDSLLGSRLTHLRPLDNSEDPFTLKTIQYCLTLVLLEDKPALRRIAQNWPQQVSVLSNLALAKGEKWSGVVAFLLRPDLHITWICRQDRGSEVWESSLQETLIWWLGDPVASCMT